MNGASNVELLLIFTFTLWLPVRSEETEELLSLEFKGFSVTPVSGGWLWNGEIQREDGFFYTVSIDRREKDEFSTAEFLRTIAKSDHNQTEVYLTYHSGVRVK